MTKNEVNEILEVTIRVIDVASATEKKQMTKNSARIWYTFNSRGICDAMASDEIDMGILTRTIENRLIRINVVVSVKVYDDFTKYHNAKDLCRNAISYWQSNGSYGL